jgi:hypothetical protein
VFCSAECEDRAEAKGFHFAHVAGPLPSFTRREGISVSGVCRLDISDGQKKKKLRELGPRVTFATGQVPEEKARDYHAVDKTIAKDSTQYPAQNLGRFVQILVDADRQVHCRRGRSVRRIVEARREQTICFRNEIEIAQ